MSGLYKKGKSRRHGGYVVYLVRCADGSYYAGSTNSLEARIALHNAGSGAKYVRGRRPVHVVYVKQYRDYQRAMQAEWAVKRLTRKQKEVLVNLYARCRNGMA